MCPCNEGTQTSDNIVYVTNSGVAKNFPDTSYNGQRRRLPPPPTNGELVANYLNAFSRFIKSTDFLK
jgi:hypothetical protein